MPVGVTGLLEQSCKGQGSQTGLQWDGSLPVLSDGMLSPVILVLPCSVGRFLQGSVALCQSGSMKTLKLGAKDFKRLSPFVYEPCQL